MTSIHRIPTIYVELGMYVSDTTPGLDQTGLNSRGLISRAETLEKLRNSCIKDIHIDVSRGKSSSKSAPVEVWAGDAEPKVSLAEERGRANKVYSEARSLVGSLVNDVKMGNAIDVGPVEGLAEDISESVLANPNALLCLSQIREKDKYLLEHSINVGILMGVFCRYLAYPRDELHQMVTGAILHDIGKIRVPDHVLNKEGKLSDKEWQLMRSHVLYGEEVLLKSEGISDIALAICAQHHEKLNGKGYPRGIAGNEVSIYGRLASVVDIYDAITADRCYQKGRSPFEAMRILASLAGEELDKKLVYQFIRCMSVYPVGSLVELSTGRLALVHQSNSKRPEAPLVKVIYNLRHHHHESPKSIDLSASNIDIKIIKVHDPEKYKIDVKLFMAD